MPMMPGLFRAIEWLVVPYGSRYNKAPTKAADFPMPSAVAEPEPVVEPEPYKWNNPELVEEYYKLKEDYKNDPHLFGRIMAVVLRSMYAAGRRDLFLAQQAGAGDRDDGPEPDNDGSSSQPVDDPEPEPVKIRPGWYFYADGALYDGFRNWGEIDAAIKKLAARGVVNFSEVEKV